MKGLKKSDVVRSEYLKLSAIDRKNIRQIADDLKNDLSIDIIEKSKDHALRLRAFLFFLLAEKYDDKTVRSKMLNANILYREV